MPADFRFHPEALSEYEDAADHYLLKAPVEIADAFVVAVESAIHALANAPTRWRIVEPPGIRCCVLRHFPYLIHYRLETSCDRVTIYAVMHGSRRPGYWRHRLHDQQDL